MRVRTAYGLRPAWLKPKEGDSIELKLEPSMVRGYVLLHSKLIEYYDELNRNTVNWSKAISAASWPARLINPVAWMENGYNERIIL